MCLSIIGWKNQFCLLKLAFAFPKPTSRKEYERIFQCNVEFNAKANQLVFDEAADTGDSGSELR
jgi:hypothetical protein